jgi:hypothetical protein
MGCKLFERDYDPVIAQVEKRKLKLSEVQDVLGSSPDSQLMDQFISMWVEEQFWYLEAKRYVKKDSNMKDQIETYQQRLLIKKYQDTILNEQIKITDKNVQEYYKEHIHEFNTQKPAAFIEIYSVSSEKEALDIITTINTSRHPNHVSQIKLVYKDDYIFEIDNILFSKSNKKVLGPIKVNDVYFVITVIERYSQNSTLALEHVKNDIIQRLQINAFSNARQKKYKELKDRYNVKFFQNTDS